MCLSWEREGERARYSFGLVKIVWVWVLVCEFCWWYTYVVYLCMRVCLHLDAYRYKSTRINMYTYYTDHTYTHSTCIDQKVQAVWRVHFLSFCNTHQYASTCTTHTKANISEFSSRHYVIRYNAQIHIKKPMLMCRGSHSKVWLKTPNCTQSRYHACVRYLFLYACVLLLVCI